MVSKPKSNFRSSYEYLSHYQSEDYVVDNDHIGVPFMFTIQPIVVVIFGACNSMSFGNMSQHLLVSIPNFETCTYTTQIYMSNQEE